MKTVKILLALAFSTLFLLSACRSKNDTSLLEQSLQFVDSGRTEKNCHLFATVANSVLEKINRNNFCKKYE
jgi:hypothetical protein